VEPEIFALNARIEDRHWWFRARRTILLDLATPVLPGDGTVLDVGCGTGGNIAAFPDACARIGVDPSLDAVRLAEEIRPGVSFVRGMVPDAVEEELSQADVVLLTDVLEHVEDDAALLAGIVRGMKHGGHLILTVPADPGLWSPHDVAHHHFRRYEAHQLRALWADLPVAPRLFAPMNRRLYPLVWGVRAVTRRLGRASGRSETDLTVPNAITNAALYRIFAGESKRLVRAMTRRARPPRGRGVSLVAVLERIDGSAERLGESS
jgi:SAM-dependent methyltransferase